MRFKKYLSKPQENIYILFTTSFSNIYLYILFSFIIFMRLKNVLNISDMIFALFKQCVDHVFESVCISGAKRVYDVIYFITI